MIAQRLRTLRPGNQYSRLIMPSLGGYLVRRDDADTTDTLRLIQEVIKKTRSQTVKLAPALKSSSLRGTCENIWNFVYQHIQYKNDRPGHEEIRHPSRVWADRVTGVDCDDYTVMISSILSNLLIPHKLRMTDYGTGKGWQHIYVVVPKDGNARAALSQTNRSAYIALDCVTDQFDHEVHYAKNQDTAMTLNELDGLPRGSRQGHAIRRRHHSVNGLGNYPGTGEVGNIFQKIGKAIKSVANGIKKVATTPIRLGILAAMKLNFPKGADKYRFGYVPYGPIVVKAGYGPEAHKKIVESLKKLIKTFVGLGGDHKVLFTTIINSKGNKDYAVPKDTPNPEAQDGFHGIGNLAGDPDWEALQQITSLQSRVTGVAGLEGLSGGGLGELGVVAETAIAAAAAVLVPILKMMSGAKADDPGDPIPPSFLPDDAADDAASVDAVADDATPTDDGSTNGFYGLGAVAKKKVKAATKVKAVVARTAAKGKPVPAKAKKAVAKATKVVKKLAPAKAKTTINTASTLAPLPASLPGVSADGQLPVAAMTPAQQKAKALAAKKAAKKAKPGIIKKAGTAIKKAVQKVGTGIKTVVDKKKAKAKVKANAKAAKKAKAAGDHATADALNQENAQVVRAAAANIDIDTAATSANTGIIKKSAIKHSKAKPATSYSDSVESDDTTQAATTVLDKTQKAVERGAMTVAQGKKIYDKVARTVKDTTGKSLPNVTTPSTDPTDDGYDPHTVVDTSPLPTDDGSTDASLAPTGSSTQASMGTMIGIGVGALLLGGLLFGGKSTTAAPYRRTAAPARTLNGLPRAKSRKRKSTTKTRKRTHSRATPGRANPGRVPLQD